MHINALQRPGAKVLISLAHAPYFVQTTLFKAEYTAGKRNTKVTVKNYGQPPSDTC